MCNGLLRRRVVNNANRGPITLSRTSRETGGKHIDRGDMLHERCQGKTELENYALRDMVQRLVVWYETSARGNLF